MTVPGVDDNWCVEFLSNQIPCARRGRHCCKSVTVSVLLDTFLFPSFFYRSTLVSSIQRISFIRKIIALLDVFWHQWFAPCCKSCDTSIYFRAFMTWQEAEKLFFLGKERILQSSAVITFCSLSGLLVLLSWPVSSLSQAIYHIVDLATFLQSL